jgi:hypothetical protein
MARDTSARPHELLDVRFGDIEIKRASVGQLYILLEISRYGKKKKSRIVLMIDSVKFIEIGGRYIQVLVIPKKPSFLSVLRKAQGIATSRYRLSLCVPSIIK